MCRQCPVIDECRQFADHNNRINGYPLQGIWGGRQYGVNSLHARLKDFMHGFKGVSTKHLQSYLAWFQWTEAFKSGPTEQRGVIGRQIRNGVYRLTRRMYVRMPMPV